jgi:transglutaminase-like putative cysteine protease
VIYAVRHRTTYIYGRNVSFARCVLRLTPQTSAVQTVLASAITITPTPTRTQARTGPFGEKTVTVVVEEDHKVLVIEATSRVEVNAPAVEQLDDSLPWETVRKVAFASADLGPESPAAFLYPTARAPLVDAITAYSETSFTPGRPVLEAADELMRRIRREFTYDPEATENSTLASEAFKTRRGVCQDFANIMISGLRGLGLPAAYVTGYLRTIPPPGQKRLEGADATHAWVRAWCGPERGWIGFDPTNALIVQNDHITLAVGRDYADTAPIDGILLGAGEQALKVEVDVAPEPETVVRPAFPQASRAG